MTFTVGANGATPLSYQWLKNGTNLSDGGRISGSTNTTFSLSHVLATDAAGYSVVVTNALGVATSSVATLSIVPIANPCVAAVLNNNPLAFYEFNETVDPTNGNVVAYDYAGGYNGTYGVGTQNGSANYNSGLGVVGPQAPAWPGFASTNKAVQTFQYAPDSQVTLPALNLNTNTVSLTAWIYPNGAVSGAGLVFCVTSNSSTVAGLGYTANLDAGSSTYTLGYTWNGILWDSGLVAPLNQWSFVALTVSATNAVVYVINGNGLYSVAHVAGHVTQAFDGYTRIGNDSVDGLNTLYRQFNGSIDDVAIFGGALTHSQVVGLYSAGSGVVNFAPQIARQPLSRGVYPGRAGQVSVSADGSQPLSYQWKSGVTNSGIVTTPLSNGSKYGGATSSGGTVSTLWVSNFAIGDVRDYGVTVVNSINPSGVTSTAATLTLLGTNGYAGAVLAGQPVAFYELNETGYPGNGNVVAYDYYGDTTGFTGLGCSLPIRIIRRCMRGRRGRGIRVFRRRTRRPICMSIRPVR